MRALPGRGGTIEIDGSRVTISALSRTEMACEDNLMASEAAYLAALAVVEAAERTDDGLALAGSDVELRFTLVPPVPDSVYGIAPSPPGVGLGTEHATLIVELLWLPA
jgi:META domain